MGGLTMQCMVFTRLASAAFFAAGIQTQSPGSGPTKELGRCRQVLVAFGAGLSVGRQDVPLLRVSQHPASAAGYYLFAVSQIPFTTPGRSFLAVRCSVVPSTGENGIGMSGGPGPLVGGQAFFAATAQAVEVLRGTLEVVDRCRQVASAVSTGLCDGGAKLFLHGEPPSSCHAPGVHRAPGLFVGSMMEGMSPSG